MSNSPRTITILTAYNHNYPFASPSPTPATNPDVRLDPSLPAVAIFTSGTTGRPKAAILPRKRFIWDYKIDPSISIPAYRPPHWVGGLQSLTRPFLEGNTIHVVPYGNTNVFWLLFRDVPFESVALTPPVLKELRDYYDKHISILSSKEVEEYLYNFHNRTKRIISSGSMIEQNVLDFWRDTLGKHIIYNAYAMTEAGWITITDLDSTLKVRVFAFLFAFLFLLLSNSLGTPVLNCHCYHLSCSPQPRMLAANSRQALDRTSQRLGHHQAQRR